MALPSSGPMRLGADVNVELGFSATAQISLGSVAVRGLYGVASGAIRLAADGRGKSSAFVFNQTISASTSNYNLRSAAIAAGWDQVLVLKATITINSGVFVTSTSTGTPAFQTGSSFPAGSTLAIINNGFIVGRGGTGGTGGFSSNRAGGTAGGSGGTALLVSASCSVTNNNTIGGGGGGGGGGANSAVLGGSGGGGGGGAGLGTGGPRGSQSAGTVNSQNGSNGTETAGGAGGAGGGDGRANTAGGRGGNGGGLGAAGATGSRSADNSYAGFGGGSPGNAVVGNANITWVATGTRLGAIS